MNTNTYSPSVVIVNNLGQDIQDARREENRLASWWTGKKKKKKRPSPFQGQKILLAALEQMRVGRETHPPRSDSQVNDIHSFVQEIWVEFLLSLVAQLVKKICLQCSRDRLDFWIRKIPWKRKWQPTPVLWPGESHRQRSLAGYRPWGRKSRTRLSD